VEKISVSMRGFFFGVKWPDVRLAALFHPLPNLGMSGSLLPRPTCLNGMHRDIIIRIWNCRWKFCKFKMAECITKYWFCGVYIQIRIKIT